MRKITLLILLASLFITCRAVIAAPFSPGDSYKTCFTPQDPLLPWRESCTEMIVHAIEGAHKTILMQAYSFTSAPIARALIYARRKGIDVKVILDKSQFQAGQYSAAKFLKNQNIPVWVDYKVAIAHNKVIIIDNKTVITGSFNFTKAAQNSNAENLLIINSPSLAELYIRNWENRQAASVPLANYKANKSFYQQQRNFERQTEQDGVRMIKKLLHEIKF